PDKKSVSLHPLIREFGQIMVQSDPGRLTWLRDACERVCGEFTQIGSLQQRGKAKGYWACLSDTQEALAYARLLDIGQISLLERIEYWLAHDSYLFSEVTRWTEEATALLYQQLTNHATEEGYVLPGMAPAARWVHQLNQVSVGERSLLRELRHP